MAKDPLMQMFDRKGGSSFDGFDQAGAELWKFRVELTYLAVISTAFGGLYLATHRSAAAAGAVLGAALMVLLLVRPLRRGVRTNLETAQVRRRWETATKHCNFPHSIPISKVERISIGHRARVRVGRGVSFVDLATRAERLAATLGVRELRVERDPHNASTGTVILVKANPLVEHAHRGWPGLDNLRAEVFSAAAQLPALFLRRGHDVDIRQPSGLSLWAPIPVGVDEHGTPVTITLPERSVLLGGVPGSGKSAALSMLLATAALDPTTKLYLVDGKMVEFAEWEPCAEEFAHSIGEAIYLLLRLQREMDDRYRILRSRGLRKVEQDSQLPLHALFIDELALFTSGTDAKASKEFTILLSDIVARCRAAGIVVVVATQKPEGSVVSTNLRDLFAYRWALRCGTPEASDTVLGRGNAAKGYNAATIAPEEPGVGYLLAEDGIPVRNRTFYLTDKDIRALAAQATEGRKAA